MRSAAGMKNVGVEHPHYCSHLILYKPFMVWHFLVFTFRYYWAELLAGTWHSAELVKDEMEGGPDLSDHVREG